MLTRQEGSACRIHPPTPDGRSSHAESHQAPAAANSECFISAGLDVIPIQVKLTHLGCLILEVFFMFVFSDVLKLL